MAENIDERKSKLIEALKQERDLFKSRGQNTYEHDLAIEYLETGVIGENVDDHELLDAVINDYDTMCNDYIN